MKYLLTLALFAPATFAETFQGFIKLEQGYELYVDHTPALPGHPTVVLVNGLVYNMDRWNSYADNLKKTGTGVLRYYFRGQSLSLLRESQDGKKAPEFFQDGLSFEKMAVELSSLIEALHIEGKVSVVGLSYGAALAAEFANAHPEKVENLILMAPLVVSLDRYDPAGAWIHQNLDAIRFWWGPLWGPQAYDYYYNLIFHRYIVDQRINQDRIPPEVAQIPDLYKESIFHLVRAVRDFDLKSYKFANGPRVHLMLASKEDEAAIRDQYAAWQAWTPANRASLTLIDDSTHAIPDSAPALAAELTLKMLAGEKDYQNESLYFASKAGLKRCSNLAALKSRKCD